MSVTLPPEAARKLEKLAQEAGGNRSAAVAKALLAAPMSAPRIRVSEREVTDFVQRADLASYLQRVVDTSTDPGAREAARECLRKLLGGA